MERMNERECEDKREREDENADGDAGLDALVSGTNVPQGTVVLGGHADRQYCRRFRTPHCAAGAR